MDTTKTITHVSLCAGYGGIDLGLSRAIPNLRTIAFSEIEAFACANLVAKMEEGLLDAAPIWTNLKTFLWSEFRDRVDILSGGYPCQPFSAAGKRLGRDDPRHLWPWIADGIRDMRPRICFFENVEGHISLGLREVISELEGLGYQTTWGVFSAREVGAPHQRKRVFILAYRKSEGLERYNGLFAGCGESRRDASEQKGQASWGNSGGNTWPSRPGQPQHGWEPPRVVGDSEHDGLPTEPIIRGDETTGDERRTQEPHQAGQLTGADRPADVSSIQGRTSGGEPVGDSEGWQDHGRESRELAEESRCGTGGDHAADCTGEGMGNAAHANRRPRVSAEEAGAGPEDIWRRRSGESGERQTQSPLGRDADGPAGGLDYAELQVSCDNRTDELRLLGNGVVPATATRAFLTLMDQLLNETP